MSMTIITMMAITVMMAMNDSDGGNDGDNGNGDDNGNDDVNAGGDDDNNGDDYYNDGNGGDVDDYLSNSSLVNTVGHKHMLLLSKRRTMCGSVHCHGGEKVATALIITG